MKTIRKNEEAVSPVIGVILMVAITVILAAVIAAFVFGMGPPAKAPQASIRGTSVNLTTNATSVTLEHQGGDNIVLATTKMIVEQGTVRVIYATSGTGADTFVTGDKLVLNANTGKIYLNGNATPLVTNPVTATGIGTLTAGAEVTVTIIDIPSSQQIGNLRIRA